MQNGFHNEGAHGGYTTKVSTVCRHIQEKSADYNQTINTHSFAKCIIYTGLSSAKWCDSVGGDAFFCAVFKYVSHCCCCSPATSIPSYYVIIIFSLFFLFHLHILSLAPSCLVTSMTALLPIIELRSWNWVEQPPGGTAHKHVHSHIWWHLKARMKWGKQSTLFEMMPVKSSGLLQEDVVTN